MRSIGKFGPIDAFVIDPLDIAVGKLFRRRTKDFDDLRDLLDAGHMTKATFEDRLRSAGETLARDPALKANAERNWHVLFGDPLPVWPAVK